MGVKLLGKIKIYELAKELDVESKKLIELAVKIKSLEPFLSLLPAKREWFIFLRFPSSELIVWRTY